jgi:hypothetical protein
MAACHPKLKNDPGADLFFSRFADSDWRGVIRPWLEACRGSLRRSIVVAPTRGQTQALKQRCVDEGVSLLGVEFLTPGLARKKRGLARPLGASLQLLVLSSRIEARLSALAPDDPARGLWKSLSSDLEAALGEFDDLARAGFRAEQFPRGELRAVFGEMVEWAAAHGYELGAGQDLAEVIGSDATAGRRIADRALILAGGSEGWAEFFGLVAMARRCASATVVIAEPDYAGRNSFSEEWVGAWERVLGVEARQLQADDPEETCGAVAELFSGGGGSAAQARVLVGRSRTDEMGLVADHVARLLAAGSDNIAVVFPGAGVAHARLAGLLAGRGIAFADLIGSVGTPPAETRIQRAIVDFYERGCRLEELLALVPLLRSQSRIPESTTQQSARNACQRLFEEVQSHSVEPHLDRLAAGGAAGAELARVARLLLPGWPAMLAPADALRRFETALRNLVLEPPAGWQALRDFCGRATEEMPANALLAAIREFLPEKGPLAGAPASSGFARVTLTTCRRAAGVAWSDSVFVEANEQVWPLRPEPSSWLGDEERRKLQKTLGPFRLGLPTSGDQEAIDRRLYCTVARDTRRSVVFSAALYDEDDPEVMLRPNTWLERVMWGKGLLSGGRESARAFERMARVYPSVNDKGAPPGPWHAIWTRRRDPAAPFDEFFLGDPGGTSRPERLSASDINRAAKDPATLWFAAVLRARRVEWRPFARSRRTAVGTAVHRMLAASLGGTPSGGPFGTMPNAAEARARLEGELERQRASRPADRYWDSFSLDAARAARELLELVFTLPCAPFCGVETTLPEGASVPLLGTERIPVSGKLDLVLSDGPGWAGARVEIVDFKTGSDKGLSVARMASSGASLQLGVYLQAARSLGATGNVWMLKPEEKPTFIGMDDIDAACARLRTVGTHLSTGLYGALTEDRTEYTHPFEWPLACAPIAFAVLEAKFARTFGAGPAEDAGEDDDE